MNKVTLLASCLLAVLPAVSTSHAQNGTWSTDSNGNWDNTSLWASGTVANGAENVATFERDAFTQNRILTLDRDRTIGQINITGSPSGDTSVALDTIGNAEVIFDNGASAAELSIVDGTGDVTIHPDIQLKSSLNVSNNSDQSQNLSVMGSISSSTAGLKTITTTTSAHPINLSGPISDGSGQVKVVINSGAGPTNFNTGHSFSGGLEINSGSTLALVNNADNSSLGSGAVVFDNGTLTTGGVFNQSTTHANDIFIASGGATFGPRVGSEPSSLTLTGVLSGSGSLTKVNSGLLIIGNASNTLSGGIIAAEGGLETNETGTLGTGDVVVGAALILGNNFSLDSNAALTFIEESHIILNYSNLINPLTIAHLGEIGSGSFIGDGTYDADELNAFFGGSVFEGTGRITVVPEPATGGLVLIGGLISLTVRRRRRS